MFAYMETLKESNYYKNVNKAYNFRIKSEMCKWSICSNVSEFSHTSNLVCPKTKIRLNTERHSVTAVI